MTRFMRKMPKVRAPAPMGMKQRRSISTIMSQAEKTTRCFRPNLSARAPLGTSKSTMLAAQTMTGADGIRAYGLPGDRVVAALRKYNRMK